MTFELKMLSTWLRLDHRKLLWTLDTYNISFLLNELLKSYSSLYFTTFYMKWICHTLELQIGYIRYNTTLKNLEALQKWRDAQFSKFLTSSHCNSFWTTSSTGFVRSIFRSLFDYITNTTSFQKSHVFNTSCIEINTAFAIFNNKGFGNFKVKPNHTVHLKKGCG